MVLPDSPINNVFLSALTKRTRGDSVCRLPQPHTLGSSNFWCSGTKKSGPPLGTAVRIFYMFLGAPQITCILEKILLQIFRLVHI